MLSKEQYQIISLTAIGGALEFYDFTIYALFAPYISQIFFPNTNTLIGIINTFAVFALGYLARPLGGIVFGHLGDKFGRKSAFSLAIFMMALATLGMGCLPSYQSIGIVAPIILIGLRLIQGFSVGGEIPGAVVFIIEHLPEKKRGFSIGLVFMCITLGNTLGAGIGLILTSLLNQEQMLAFGWRIPFIIGFCLGIISYIFRVKAIETPIFLDMLAEKKLYRQPLLELMRLSRRKLVNAFLLTALTSSVIALFLYFPTYLSSIINIKMSHAYLINLMSFLCIALMSGFFGQLSDKVNREKLLIIGASLLIILSFPLFYGLTIFGESFVWIFILGFSLLGGMINGSFVVLIAESFPPQLRYSGVGFSYSLGVAIFGGMAPLVFTQLIQQLNFVEAPALYLFGCAIFTLFALLSYRYEGKTIDYTART